MILWVKASHHSQPQFCGNDIVSSVLVVRSAALSSPLRLASRRHVRTIINHHWRRQPVTLCAKISQNLNTIKGKYKFAELTIASLFVGCSTTTIALSHLENALRNKPGLIGTPSHSIDNMMNIFELGISGITIIFSLLDEELSMGINKLKFRKRVKYIWNEALIKELAQQIRDQRSSISFLLSCVQMNLKSDGGTLPVINSATERIFRDNYTKAKSLRSQSSYLSMRSVYASDLDSILERGSRNESYETTLLQSQPYIQAQYSHAQVHSEISSYKDDHLSIPHDKEDTVSSIPVEEDFVDGNFCIERMAQIKRRCRVGTRSNEPKVESTTYSDDGSMIPPEVSPSMPTEFVPAEKKLDISGCQIEEENNTVIDIHSREPGSVVQASSLNLHKQIADGNIVGVEALLKAGVDVNYVTKLEGDISERYSPLGRAIEVNHAKIVKLLLKHGVDLESVALPKAQISQNNTSWDCETALYIACRKGHLEMTNLLLEGNGVVVLETPNWCGRTSLENATCHGFNEIVEVLLQAGANLYHKDFTGRTSLHLVAQRGHVATAKVLVKYGAELDSGHWNSETPLHLAIRDHHAEIIKLLLNSGASANVKSVTGITPLMLAAWKGDTTTMKLLLEKGADINLFDINEWTALHKAAYKGHVEVCEVLLEHGASIDSRNTAGATPLMVARKKDHQNIAELVKNFEGSSS
ncbi:uncharacterized protein PAC_14721 [Phialocephala subalpina]|uniref:Uncharacterized protein n=1 Tax=Phialocephala subalpina TaxID=576137 RepID=A0A1L7XIG0_9HELO|nr:uncharacterized protein PAC_14721 [Phialocephala subalpina]